MAHRPKVFVDGVEYPHVFEVSYRLYTQKDETGRPTDRAHAGTIRMRVESAEDGNVDLARWAMDTSKTNWKSGEVQFFNKDGADMKKLTWEDGFVTEFEEMIPHIKDRPDEQVYQYLEISANKITVGDAEIVNYWDK